MTSSNRLGGIARAHLTDTEPPTLYVCCSHCWKQRQRAPIAVARFDPDNHRRVISVLTPSTSGGHSSAPINAGKAIVTCPEHGPMSLSVRKLHKFLGGTNRISISRTGNNHELPIRATT